MEPFIGEIRLLPYIFAPQGWLPCDGRQLPISSYQALAAVLGTTYGGDGRTYFNIPKMQGYTPVGANSPNPTTVQLGLGKTSGVTAVTLGQGNYPTHNHDMNGIGAGAPTNRLNKPASTNRPGGILLNGATSPTALNDFSDVATPNTSFASAAIGNNNTGVAAVTAHENQQPYLPLQFMIAWDGIFPERPS